MHDHDDIPEYDWRNDFSRPRSNLITTTIANAIDYADELQSDALVDIDGIKLRVNGNSDVEKSFAELQERKKERYEAYKHSPEGIAAAAREKAELEKRQKAIEEFIGQPLDDAVQAGAKETLEWLLSYADMSSNQGLNKHTATIHAKLESAGYAIDAHHNDPKVDTDKETFAKFSIGQIMVDIAGGCGANPRMVRDFILQYENMGHIFEDYHGRFRNITAGLCSAVSLASEKEQSVTLMFNNTAIYVDKNTDIKRAEKRYLADTSVSALDERQTPGGNAPKIRLF
ncbi:MAG: hypothetical protein OXT65_08430 [Alphaproteobacteria bacterium]|nr:hypothetical protein [Alphaproteobacteria bacterium]